MTKRRRRNLQQRRTKATLSQGHVILVLLLLVVCLVGYVFLKNKLESSQVFGDTTKPNILVIMTDDQRDDWLQFMPLVQSRLRDRGMTFSNSFVTTSLCCPSRSSFFSGRYAHDHNVWDNEAPDGGATKFNDASTLPIWLKAAGYRTSLIGKYLNQYDLINPYIPPGWDDWHVFNDKNGKYYGYLLNENGVSTSFGNKEADYSTDVFRQKAVTFVQQTTEPFFLLLTPHTPHGPAKVAKRHQSQCTETFTPPPSFNEADVSDKPTWIKKLPLLTQTQQNALIDERRLKICMLKAVDEAVDAIITALGPKIANTVIIFTSDNGYVLGEHRYQDKNCWYEECLRVPLVISTPQMASSGALTNNELVTNIDIVATIAELAGVDVTGKVINGKSLVPYLNGQTTPLQDTILFEHLRNRTGKTYGVRTKQYKYAELGNGEKEFYDLTNDPYELVNKASDASYASVIQDLAAKLAVLKSE